MVIVEKNHKLYFFLLKIYTILVYVKNIRILASSYLFFIFK